MFHLSLQYLEAVKNEPGSCTPRVIGVSVVVVTSVKYHHAPSVYCFQFLKNLKGTFL